MAEITPPHIEPITADPGPGPRDQSSPKHKAKAATASRHGSPEPPKIEPSEEDRHQLDEMA